MKNTYVSHIPIDISFTHASYSVQWFKKKTKTHLSFCDFVAYWLVSIKFIIKRRIDVIKSADELQVKFIYINTLVSI